MGDMTIEHFYFCKSLEDFSTIVESSDGKKTYKVRKVHGWWAESALFDWQCDCKGWQFRKMCSHIKKVRASEEYCGWDQFADGGEADIGEDGVARCPKCGRLAGVLKHAV